MKTLKSNILNDFQYSVGKIYEGIYNDYPLAKMNFDSVKSTCESLKTEIDTDQLLNNHDAELFLDTFRGCFIELEEMDRGEVQKK